MTASESGVTRFIVAFRLTPRGMLHVVEDDIRKRPVEFKTREAAEARVADGFVGAKYQIIEVTV